MDIIAICNITYVLKNVICLGQFRTFKIPEMISVALFWQNNIILLIWLILILSNKIKF
jgi:hypothetical protein